MIEPFRLVADSAYELTRIRELFLEYQDELGVDLCFQSFQEELDSLPGKYGAPNGKLYLVEQEGRFIGCGALRLIEPGVAEIKRIYIQPAFRGRGLAEGLSRRLIKDARELGYKTCKLDTLARLVPAVKMYQKLGFKQTVPYNYNPEGDILYFELAL